MRFLIFCAATFFVLTATALPPTPNTINSVIESEAPQVTIVMEDAVMMRVTSDGTVGTITEIKVTELNGQLAFLLNGCGKLVCRVNLSSLNPANYNVYVNTSSGQSFSGSIKVGS